MALGLQRDSPALKLHTAIRFGVGRFTTPEEIEEAGSLFVDKVAEVRADQAALGL